MRLLAPVRRSTFLVLLGAAMVSVALTVGVALRAPVPTAAGAPEPVASTSTRAAAPAGRYRAVAGPACPVDAARNVRISAAWQVIAGDSWTGDGCGDRFLYSSPGDANYVRWQFRLDEPAVCRIAVFVPDSPLAPDTVWYGVGDRLDNPDYRVGGFTVDQKANRGRWVEGASVPVRGGVLMVDVEGNQNLTGVVAAALRVSC
jgi:hypothetical protein